MAYTTIDKSTDYFNTKLYNQNATGSHAITGVGHQPDLLWFKDRSSGSRNHRIVDAVRGVGKLLKVDGTSAENTEADTLTSFDSDGFTLGADANDYGLNGDNGNSTVAWSWKAGTTSGITTTGADITPSSYSMSATSGISIIKFTGNGVDGAKIAHGLGAVPEMIISKRLENSNYWAVFHKLDNTDYFVLNTNDASSDAPLWKDTNPTSVYYQTDNSNSVNPTNETVVAYCFKSVTGFSKIGSYTGTNGLNFIYTGFKPKWCMFKRKDSGDNWKILDSERSTFNIMNETLSADTSSAEGTESDVYVDFLSNGIRLDGSNGAINASGGTYIFMAFAEAPLVGSNNVPCTAR